MPDSLLYVFAKEPRPGEVKTRLCPPLSLEQACRCSRAFVEDTVARLRGVQGVEVRLAISPDDAPWLRSTAERFAIRAEPQGGGDLGCRLARVLRRGLAERPAALAVGADVPDLPLDAIHRARACLRDGRVPVGPSHDGGYYLIGFQGLIADVFRLDTAWGGAGVLAETLERLASAGHVAELLAPWDDVDDLDGLRRLRARIRRGSAMHTAGAPPATMRVLDELDAEGVRL